MSEARPDFLNHRQHMILNVLRSHGYERWYFTAEIHTIINAERGKRAKRPVSANGLNRALRSLHKLGLLAKQTIHDDGRIRIEWRARAPEEMEVEPREATSAENP